MGSAAYAGQAGGGVLNGAASVPVWLGLRFQKRDERFSVTPHQEKLESGKNQSRREAFRRHQRVKDHDVKENGSENC